MGDVSQPARLTVHQVRGIIAQAVVGTQLEAPDRGAEREQERKPSEHCVEAVRYAVVQVKVQLWSLLVAGMAVAAGHGLKLL